MSSTYPRGLYVGSTWPVLPCKKRCLCRDGSSAQDALASCCSSRVPDPSPAVERTRPSLPRKAGMIIAHITLTICAEAVNPTKEASSPIKARSETVQRSAFDTSVDQSHWRIQLFPITIIQPEQHRVCSLASRSSEATIMNTHLLHSSSASTAASRRSMARAFSRDSRSPKLPCTQLRDSPPGAAPLPSTCACCMQQQPRMCHARFVGAHAASEIPATASGRMTYRPASYAELVSDAAAALLKGIDSGLTRMEVEFPPIPTNVDGEFEYHC